MKLYHLAVGFFVLFGFINLSLFVGAVNYTCYNPEQSAIFCQPLSLSRAEVNTLCCGDNISCQNAFVDVYEPGACTLGCCYAPQEQTCTSYTIKKACKGLFLPSEDGSCFPHGKALVAACQSVCCCTNEGAFLLSQNQCEIQQGIAIENPPSEAYCQQLCQSYPQVNGCAEKKPYFYKNSQRFEDCTGGDGVVGNGNDCGCPNGAQCLSNGQCIPQPQRFRCNNHSVSSCDQCPGKPLQKNNVCVNATAFCSSTSSYFQGFCICNEGYFDEYCHDSLQLDLDANGCVSFNPCEKKVSWWQWFLMSILLLAGGIFLYWKEKKQPPREPPQKEIFPHYPQDSYYSYPSGRKYL